MTHQTATRTASDHLACAVLPPPDGSGPGRCVRKGFWRRISRGGARNFCRGSLVDIVEEEFDAGFRLRELIDTDMIAVRLSPPFDHLVVGSPKYFSRHERPIRPHDLREDRCIRSRRSSRVANHRWEFLHTKGSSRLACADRSSSTTQHSTFLPLRCASRIRPRPLQCHVSSEASSKRVLREFCPSSLAFSCVTRIAPRHRAKVARFYRFRAKAFCSGASGAPATATLNSRSR